MAGQMQEDEDRLCALLQAHPQLNGTEIIAHLNAQRQKPMSKGSLAQLLWRLKQQGRISVRSTPEDKRRRYYFAPDNGRTCDGSKNHPWPKLTKLRSSHSAT